MTLIGLGAAWWAIDGAGWPVVWRAAERLGVAGFLLFCGWSALVTALLGGAWWSVARGEPPARARVFVAARLVREGVADLLPLSQLGGVVAGARLLHAVRVPPSRIYASMVADQAAEMATQLCVTLWGLAAVAALLADDRAVAVRSAVFAGAALLGATVLGFLVGQRPLLRLAAAIVRRLVPRAAAAVAGVEAELGAIYADRRRVAACVLLNLAAWLAAAGGAWGVLASIGTPVSPGRVIALESLVAIVRSAAFAVPGAIGFQEAAYALLAPVFGLSAPAALALSLARRGRDLVFGVAALFVWQGVELRGCGPR